MSSGATSPVYKIKQAFNQEAIIRNSRSKFRCPTCGHVMGEEEYRRACNQFNKKAQEMYNQREEEQDKRHRQEMQEQDKRHRQEFDTAVKQEANLR